MTKTSRAGASASLEEDSPDMAATTVGVQEEGHVLDRSPLIHALNTPGHTAAARAIFIAAFGQGPSPDIDPVVTAAALGVHPNRIRAWLRLRTDSEAATAIVREILARYPSPAGTGVDVAAAAEAIGVHETTVRRWMRTDLDPAAVLTAIRRILLTLVPTAHIQSVNLQAACAALKVQPGTVRRWLRTPADRPPLPLTRAQQLVAMTAPTQQILVRERLQVQHARESIHRLMLGRGRGGMTAQYGESGWLEPHIVAVLQLPGSDLQRVTTTRLSQRTLQRMRQTGDVVDFTTEPLPHKFAATLLRHALLQEVTGWRVLATPGAVEALDRGHTQTWIATPPLPSLDQLARTLDLRQ